MKQTSLVLGKSNIRAHRRVFVEEIDRVVPWQELMALISLFMPEGRRGWPPFPLKAMLPIHFMQQWFNQSHPGDGGSTADMALFRDFAGLDGWEERVPNEAAIPRFRCVLEKHKLAPQILGKINEMLRAGKVVDATLIAAPSQTKNATGERDRAMKQSPMVPWHEGPPGFPRSQWCWHADFIGDLFLSTDATCAA